MGLCPFLLVFEEQEKYKRNLVCIFCGYMWCLLVKVHGAFVSRYNNPFLIKYLYVASTLKRNYSRFIAWHGRLLQPFYYRPCFISLLNTGVTI